MNWLHGSLGVSAVAIVIAAFAYGAVSAQGAPAPTCNSLKDQTGCTAREDCSWVSASIDPKTNKEKRKAYCRSKPKMKKT